MPFLSPIPFGLSSPLLSSPLLCFQKKEAALWSLSLTSHHNILHQSSSQPLVLVVDRTAGGLHSERTSDFRREPCQLPHLFSLAVVLWATHTTPFRVLARFGPGVCLFGLRSALPLAYKNLARTCSRDVPRGLAFAPRGRPEDSAVYFFTNAISHFFIIKKMTPPFSQMLQYA